MSGPDRILLFMVYDNLVYRGVFSLVHSYSSLPFVIVAEANVQLLSVFAPAMSSGIIARGEVHVWCVSLNSETAPFTALNALLCDEELVRARRFRFDHHRRRYIVARAMVRILLGRYLQKRGEEICFEYGPKGKPRLGGSDGGSGLRFNISHSNELALMAFCLNEEVGVDVEAVHEMGDAESILRNHFCPEEIEQWLSLPAQFRARGFFDCWTRKEAYVKAVGDGLSLPLDEFQVAFLPGEKSRIRMRSGDEDTWSLFDVSPAPDYAGALAIRGSGWKLNWYTTAGMDLSWHLS